MRAKRMLGLLLLGAHVSVLAPRVAWAAPRDAAVEDAARARTEEGVRFYAKRQYDRAMASFLQAYGLTRSPSLLLNMGLTSLRRGDPLRAARLFDKFLKEAPDAPEAQRAKARSGLVDARQRLGAIEVQAPEGAEITVDGEAAGRAPLAGPVDALPGKHVVTATTSSGSRSESVDVTLTTVAKVHLVAPAAPPPSVVSAPEEHAVAKEEGRAPSPANPEAPGLFAPPAHPAPAYVAGALGVASLSVAIILRSVGANADRNVDTATEALARSGKTLSACRKPDATVASACESISTGTSTSSSVQTPFVATLVVGAGATVFALGWWMFASKASAEARTRVVPTVGTTGAGAQLDLAF